VSWAGAQATQTWLGDAVAVGDGGQPGVGLVGDGSDADRVALAFVDGQPVVEV
jgi:hypothetical protein